VAREKKQRLELYPSRVAAALVIASIVLYFFFTLWPLAFSVYIAFTDANAVNIAAGPKVAKLREEKAAMIRHLEENRETIRASMEKVRSMLVQAKSELEELQGFLQKATPADLAGGALDEYRARIDGLLAKTIAIVNSNESYLYRYTEFRESLVKVSSVLSTMWGRVDSILGFKLIPSDEDVKALREQVLPLLNEAIRALDDSISLLDKVVKDYSLFEKMVVRDIDEEIDKLSVHFVGLENFRKLFSTAYFPYSILKTLLFVATSVPIKVAVGVLLAFFFSTPMIYGRRIMRALLLIPWSLPVLLSVTTWRMLFVPGQGPFAKVFSSLLGYGFNIFTREWDAFLVYNIVEMWLAYPFIMTVTMGAIASVPKELIEAAYIDGAGVFTRFQRIMLPLTKKPILFAAILTTGASLQAFMVPLLINQGGPAKTLYLPGFKPALGNSNEMMVLFGYNRAWLDQQYGLSAASYLVVVAILLLYAVAWFYLVYKGGEAGRR
jgi:arabinogalactan oligomer/maltooligosaccharide transport system permease protein